MAGIFDGISNVVGSIADKIAPDKTEVIQSDNEVAKAQIAQNQAAIIAGKGDWVPLVGKTCAYALIFQDLIRPFICSILTIAPLFGADPHMAATTCANLPQIDLTTIMSILLPMLGITFHTYMTGKRQ